MAIQTTQQISRGWKETTLGEIAELSKSQWNPGDKEEKYIGLEHINQEELGINGFGYSSKLKSNKFHFKTGDVLFGKLRPYFRKVWKAKFDGVCSTDIWVLRAKENNDQGFLFYFVANPVFINQSMGANTGTHMPRADWSFLENTEWRIPPLPEQRAIAGVLSSLDNKIELLRKQNKTLEATAQTIFKEWFSVKSDKLPKGWKIGKLADEFEIVMGQSPEGESYNENREGMIFFQGRTDFGFRFPSTRLYTTSPKRTAEKFDVLVSVRAPVGDINMAFDICCIGRGVAAVKSKFKSYAYYRVRTLKRNFENFESSGTIFGSMNKDDFNDIEVAIPDKNLVMKFENLAKPIDSKIYNNYQQLQSLSKLRDVILPKLMRGEIRVKKLSK